MFSFYGLHFTFDRGLRFRGLLASKFTVAVGFFTSGLFLFFSDKAKKIQTGFQTKTSQEKETG